MESNLLTYSPYYAPIRHYRQMVPWVLIWYQNPQTAYLPSNRRSIEFMLCDQASESCPKRWIHEELLLKNTKDAIELIHPKEIPCSKWIDDDKRYDEIEKMTSPANISFFITETVPRYETCKWTHGIMSNGSLHTNEGGLIMIRWIGLCPPEERV